MNSNYKKEFEVHYYEINKYQEATPVAIINYLEETAIAHSEFVGYRLERLKKDGYGWVLNRWSINIEKYPLWGEKILVETWPSRFEKFYANREFKIFNGNGIEIGRASSLWIFMNTEKRRPTRIPYSLAEAYKINGEIEIVPFSKEFEKVEHSSYEKGFKVRRSDIDTNNHVNNTKYVEWLLEGIPDEVYNNYNLSCIEIIYKKETYHGSSVYVNCSDKYEKYDIIEFDHSIFDYDRSIELASAKTRWCRRIF